MLAAIERRLQGLLADGSIGDGSTLRMAMREAVLAPAKRLRPLMVLVAARTLGCGEAEVLDVACALEMLHTASLIFDDLPCMDDANARRGRPATHVAYGEDVAILSGLALFSQAFAIVAADRLPAPIRAELVGILAEAAGAHGICGGQLDDLQTARPPQLGPAEAINHLKTGVLFVAAVDIAASIGCAGAAERSALRAFARQFGLAFQLRDDLRDADPVRGGGARGGGAREGGAADDGVHHGERTLVASIGAPGAGLKLGEYIDAAAAALAPFGSGQRHLARLLEMTFGACPAEV